MKECRGPRGPTRNSDRRWWVTESAVWSVVIVVLGVQILSKSIGLHLVPSKARGNRLRYARSWLQASTAPRAKTLGTTGHRRRASWPVPWMVSIRGSTVTLAMAVTYPGGGRLAARTRGPKRPPAASPDRADAALSVEASCAPHQYRTALLVADHPWPAPKSRLSRSLLFRHG